MTILAAGNRLQIRQSSERVSRQPTHDRFRPRDEHLSPYASMSSRNPLLTLFREQLENEARAVASQHELLRRGDALIWWYFSRLTRLSADEIAEVVCDGSNDLGIDAIYIDADDIVHIYQFKHPERIESGFPGGDVDKVLSGLHLILNRRHADVANEELVGRVEEIYQMIPTGYVLHLVTSGTGLSTESREKLHTFVTQLGGPADDFFSWRLEDIEYLQDAFYQKSLPAVTEPIFFSAVRQPPYQIRSATHDCYLLHADGSTLAGLYENFGEQLLQQNIRVYQGDRATNAAIRKTSTSNQSANFFHYNNGVTFLCETAVWDQFVGRLTLNKAQVVNGGQTIRVLHAAARDGALKSDVLVPVRVITSQGDKEFASNVAVNLNNQNRIESSFLRSNDPRILQLSSALSSLGWYLERRENEVDQLSTREREEIERRIGQPLSDRTMRLKDATQAYVATFFRQPELAKKNPKKMFLGQHDGGFFERVFSADLKAQDFVIAQRIRWGIDQYVREFMSLKRRKKGVEDWKSEYAGLLGPELVGAHGDTLDQVIPQSAVFLSAIVFEEQVRILERDPSALAELLEGVDKSLLNSAISTVIEVAADSPIAADKSWPNLLKSQAFFDIVVSYLRGARNAAETAATRPDPRTA
jgi:hypothetical protein